MLHVPGVEACGYHNPISLARGMMNWVYPDSLHVQTAVWRAEDAGILPKREPGPQKDLFAFARISKAMRAYGDVIAKADAAADEMPNIAVVLIDSMMWTRFVRMDSGYTVEVHAEGPTQGDVVMVTASKVVAALLGAQLQAQDGVNRGLIRLYGLSDSVAKVEAQLTRIPRGGGGTSVPSGIQGR